MPAALPAAAAAAWASWFGTPIPEPPPLRSRAGENCLPGRAGGTPPWLAWQALPAGGYGGLSRRLAGTVEERYQASRPFAP